MRVLIVDDLHDARQVLRYMVEKNGHEAIEAANGADALEIVKDSPPDLIISDALMPVMDGFQFLRALKQEAELSAIPFVIYSSTYKEEQDVRLAMSLGADAYLFKPLEPVELWEEITAILERARHNRKEPGELVKEDADYLKRYSEVVATKLEEKVLELEKVLAEREQAQELLRQQKDELTAIFENAPFMMMVLDSERRIRKANSLTCSFTGLSMTEMEGMRAGEALHCLHAPADSDVSGTRCRDCALYQTINDTFTTGQGHCQVEVILLTGSEGREQRKTFLISTSGITVDHSPLVLLSLQDISDYKMLEEQLRQSQKMEAVGTLAGGVAHDFNNMLGVILGHAEMAVIKLDQAKPILSDLEAILQAANRSANLTRQLLAFARRQAIAPKVLDLNEVIEGLMTMLRRLIGEDIEIVWRPKAGVCLVKMDPSQIDQILVNLCINARDAIAGVGKISIETHAVTLDADFCAEHPEFVPGEYALLAVSDDGCGMDAEIMDKVFEPFFTTKETGQGTGLGLATVYGIVKQNNAFILVSSKPDQGTTFKIYLPCCLEKIKTVEEKQPETPAAGGGETILLVEDEPSILRVTKLMLESFGYRVLATSDANEAIELARQHAADIDLLLSDVILPEMNGKELKERLISFCPGLKTLFMSGYTGDIITRRGVLAEGAHFIQKPFFLDALADKVRSVLDSEAG